MSRMHFDGLAKALKEQRPEAYVLDGGAYTGVGRQWVKDVNAIAGVCMVMNPRFDLNRFLEACGV